MAAFLDAIQTANTRIFVPTTVDSVSAKADAEAQPPTDDGDLEFTVVGNLYVLQEATVDPTVAPEDGPSEPLPSSEVNPFESLAGIPR